MRKLLALLVAMLQLSCGAGGGLAQGGGVGGTGISAGAISGFGSIFVTGTEYDVNGAQIRLERANGSAADLRVGMVVVVEGERSADGTTGTAQRVDYDDEIEGPISALALGHAGCAPRHDPGPDDRDRARLDPLRRLAAPDVRHARGERPGRGERLPAHKRHPGHLREEEGRGRRHTDRGPEGHGRGRRGAQLPARHDHGQLERVHRAGRPARGWPDQRRLRGGRGHAHRAGRHQRDAHRARRALRGRSRRVRARGQRLGLRLARELQSRWPAGRRLGRGRPVRAQQPRPGHERRAAWRWRAACRPAC